MWFWCSVNFYLAVKALLNNNKKKKLFEFKFVLFINITEKLYNYSCSVITDSFSIVQPRENSTQFTLLYTEFTSTQHKPFTYVRYHGNVPRSCYPSWCSAKALISRPDECVHSAIPLLAHGFDSNQLAAFRIVPTFLQDETKPQRAVVYCLDGYWKSWSEWIFGYELFAGRDWVQQNHEYLSVITLAIKLNETQVEKSQAKQCPVQLPCRHVIDSRQCS